MSYAGIELAELRKKYKAAGLTLPTINYATKYKSQYLGEWDVELNTSVGTVHVQTVPDVATAKLHFLQRYYDQHAKAQDAIQHVAVEPVLGGLQARVKYGENTAQRTGFSTKKKAEKWASRHMEKMQKQAEAGPKFQSWKIRPQDIKHAECPRCHQQIAVSQGKIMNHTRPWLYGVQKNFKVDPENKRYRCAGSGAVVKVEPVPVKDAAKYPQAALSALAKGEPASAVSRKFNVPVSVLVEVIRKAKTSGFFAYPEGYTEQRTGQRDVGGAKDAVKRCALCNSGKVPAGMVYCAKCSQRLEAGETAAQIMMNPRGKAKDSEFPMVYEVKIKTPKGAILTPRIVAKPSEIEAKIKETLTLPAYPAGSKCVSYSTRGTAWDASDVRIVHNKLLGGWYVVRGPAQTPLSGRFNSKEEAQASLNRKPAAKQACAHTSTYGDGTCRFCGVNVYSSAKDVNPFKAERTAELSQYPANHEFYGGQWKLKKLNGGKFESATVHPSREHAEASAKKTGHRIVEAKDADPRGKPCPYCDAFHDPSNQCRLAPVKVSGQSSTLKGQLKKSLSQGKDAEFVPSQIPMNYREAGKIAVQEIRRHQAEGKRIQQASGSLKPEFQRAAQAHFSAAGQWNFVAQALRLRTDEGEETAEEIWPSAYRLSNEADKLTSALGSITKAQDIEPVPVGDAKKLIVKQGRSGNWAVFEEGDDIPVSEWFLSKTSASIARQKLMGGTVKQGGQASKNMEREARETMRRTEHNPTVRKYFKLDEP